MAKKKNDIDLIDESNEIIENSPLEEVMGDRYATYAKYVIQDRAIPDVRDGLKPVQRRIIFSMWKEGNVSTKPTKKCAHTVGAVMGNYHPHGDSSIYEALARMSQDWKVREPLIDFQGNNGSIDGDVPAAYRYTEARLSEIADEMIRDIDKKTVDMNLTFDDTNLEPDVLPSRFPNLLVNGSEGIAVALATEIPPHNLEEVINATIYRMEHKNCDPEKLREFVLGPDFPTGGIVYRSEGLDSIYQTGRGRIEIASKCEIVTKGSQKQIIITEIPYKVVKIQLVYEIDKIRHDKIIDGIDEVRDESDIEGLKIAIDLKKDANADIILAYLMKQTELKTSYSANIVAISNGRPKTLSLVSAIDAYIDHQVDVITRRSKFDLQKYENRLHIVNGLVLAISNYEEVVRIIQKSQDKQDSKINLQNRFGLSEQQSEAIVMLPLYKLSHTDVNTLLNEKAQLESDIAELKDILANPEKLDRVIIKDLKTIAKKYGNPRRTQIIDKEETTSTFSKRDLISSEDVMLAITADGYIKRSSMKSFKSSNGEDAGIKDGDTFVYVGEGNTKDYVIGFTKNGSYLILPVYEFPEEKWKDEGKHINTVITFNSANDKIIKCFVVKTFRDDLYFTLLSKKGQIKRTRISDFFVEKTNRPLTAMRVLSTDELVSINMTSGSSNLMIFTANGRLTVFNENQLIPVGPKASGVKAVSELSKTWVSGLVTYEDDERSKILLVTDKGNVRIFDTTHAPVTKRLGKKFEVFKTFKNEVQTLAFVDKISNKNEALQVKAYTTSNELITFEVNEFYFTPLDKYASKSSIDLDPKLSLSRFFRNDCDIIDDSIESKDFYVPPVKDELSDVIEHIELVDTEEDSEQTTLVEDSQSTEIISEENEEKTSQNGDVIETKDESLEEKTVEERYVPKHEKKDKKEEKTFDQLSIFGDDDL